MRASSCCSRSRVWRSAEFAKRTHVSFPPSGNGTVGSHGRTYDIATAHEVLDARGDLDGTALAMAEVRRYAVTTLIAMFIQVLLSLHAAAPAQTIKTVVADG